MKAEEVASCVFNKTIPSRKKKLEIELKTQVTTKRFLFLF